MRSSSLEHQEALYRAPLLTLLCLHNGSNAAKVTTPDLNSDLYFAMFGDDGDFVVGGDIVGLDLGGQLRHLDMPVLVLAGRFDRVCTPKITEQFKTFAPQAQFVMCEELGYFPFVEEPDFVFDTIRAFLSH